MNGISGVQNSSQDMERELSMAALDHVWRYFALHAAQRLSMFNFYIVLIGVSSAGLGAALQGSSRFAVLGVILGILISLISFVFWQFDQRGSMLIKHSEQVLCSLEPGAVGDAGSIFVQEAASSRLVTNGWNPLGVWSFGRCLRLIFLVTGVFGVGGAAVSGMKATGFLTWEGPAKSECNSNIASTCTSVRQRSAEAKSILHPAPDISKDGRSLPQPKI